MGDEKPEAELSIVRRHARLGWARFSWRDTAAPLLIVLAVLLAHAIELSGWLSSNPIYLISGLGLRSAPGPLAGVPGWVEFYAGATTQAMGRLDAYDWVRGMVPWWNPYVGVGMPLAAEMQSSSLFLPFVLLHVFFDGVMSLKIAMQLIAGLATYALLRSLALGRFGAVTGGLLYSLTGSFAWFSDAVIMPTPFLPLLLLGIEHARSAARQCRPGGFCWIGVAIAYLQIAGFPETAYFCGLFALSWAIFRFVSDPAVRFAFAVKVVAGGTIGLMIAAPCLLAFFHFLKSRVGAAASLRASRALSAGLCSVSIPLYFRSDPLQVSGPRLVPRDRRIHRLWLALRWFRRPVRRLAGARTSLATASLDRDLLFQNRRRATDHGLR